METDRGGNAVAPSQVRFLHALPQVQPVDIYLSGHKVAQNLDYKAITDYIPVMPGLHEVKVFLANDITAPVMNTVLEVPDDAFITVAATGMSGYLELMVVPDGFLPQNAPADKAYIRFIHFSPNALPVDVRVGGGTIIAENILYGVRTEYIELNPGRYNLNVYRTGTRELMLSAPNVNLEAGTVYTVYVVGLNRGNPPIEAVLAIDKAHT